MNDTAMEERKAIVTWLRLQEVEHAESYQGALTKGDQGAMDRCAARANTYNRAAEMIERGEHIIDGPGELTITSHTS